MAVKLEVGKKYTSMQGDVFEIIENDGTDYWPFIGVNAKTREYQSFEIDGRWGIGHLRDYDLVSEYNEPAHEKETS